MLVAGCLRHTSWLSQMKHRHSFRTRLLKVALRPRFTGGWVTFFWCYVYGERSSQRREAQSYEARTPNDTQIRPFSRPSLNHTLLSFFSPFVLANAAAAFFVLQILIFLLPLTAVALHCSFLHTKMVRRPRLLAPPRAAPSCVDTLIAAPRPSMCASREKKNPLG